MTDPATGVTHLVVGPLRHGVVTFAMDLVDALRMHGNPAPVVRVENWSDLDDALARLGPVGGVHLNFTDRLFGSTPGDAADRVAGLVRHFADVRVTATLHDVPQPADGGNHLQRTAAYRAVCSALHGRATNSEHERHLLGESHIADPADVVVVAFPLRIAGTPVRPSGDGRSVAVLGFLYPGKGHAEVLAAMADVDPAVEFVAVGQCSTGHEDMAGHLARTAGATGRPFTITGYVPSDALTAVLQRVTVPVAHHRHVSASRSLNTWIEAHRRPLVPANRYTVEHDERHPDTLRLYRDSPRGLAAAIEAALHQPDSTWLPADRTAETTADVARRYARALSRWHG